MWEGLKEIKERVLVIWGRVDKKFCEMGKGMEEEVEQSQLRLVEHGGDRVDVEEGDFFGKIVSEFILWEDQRRKY